MKKVGKKNAYQNKNENENSVRSDIDGNYVSIKCLFILVSNVCFMNSIALHWFCGDMVLKQHVNLLVF